MKKDWPCECGHIRQAEEHFLFGDMFSDNDHPLHACRFCECKRFRPSNLRYLEQLSEQSKSL
jgi:hypothetical protein